MKWLAKFNIACPRVKRNREARRTFTMTACREWNKLPLHMRKAETLKTSLWNRIFKDQQFLNIITIVPHAYNCFNGFIDF